MSETLKAGFIDIDYDNTAFHRMTGRKAPDKVTRALFELSQRRREGNYQHQPEDEREQQREQRAEPSGTELPDDLQLIRPNHDIPGCNYIL